MDSCIYRQTLVRYPYYLLLYVIVCQPVCRIHFRNINIKKVDNFPVLPDTHQCASTITWFSRHSHVTQLYISPWKELDACRYTWKNVLIKDNKYFIIKIFSLPITHYVLLTYILANPWNVAEVCISCKSTHLITTTQKKGPTNTTFPSSVCANGTNCRTFTKLLLGKKGKKTTSHATDVGEGYSFREMSKG